ncbi:hypothetical protein [Sinomonas sp. G460-2]|uniref:hypothetical protein n=1 Tax=Sinomonas sp. G460-2 TaxID=3393464 RepID=UPI0039EF63D8
MNADPPPDLEPARLDTLAVELDSRDDACAFAAKFLDLLPRRLQKIAATVQAGDVEAAHVALLSLAVSAEMVGALRLERNTRHADRELRAGRLGGARGAIPELNHDADAVARALTDLLRAR